jgi:hypothetical protein
VRVPLVALLLFVGCGDDSTEAAPTVGLPCADDSTCSGDFSCADLGDGTRLCTVHCSEDPDCGGEGRCVDVGEEGDPHRVCLMDCAENEEACPEGTACTIHPAEPAAVCR